MPNACQPRFGGVSECDADTCSAGGSVFGDDRAPMGSDDRRDDRETETGASVVTGPAEVGPAEPFERMWKEGRIESGAVVDHLEPQVWTCRFGAHFDRRAGRAVSQRVVDEVVDDLPYSVRVDGCEKAGGSIDSAGHPVLGDPVLRVSDDPFEKASVQIVDAATMQASS